MAKGSWRNTEEYTHSEDNPNPAFRPKVDHLLTQLRNHSALKDHPDAAEFIISQLMHRFFVFERARPRELFRLMNKANALWSMTLAPGLRDENNDRQVESAQNAVTGDELPKSGSLVSDFGPYNWDELTEVYQYLTEAPIKFDNRVLDYFIRAIGDRLTPPETWRDKAQKNITGIDLTGVEEVVTKKRNDTTPGPSHKSPVLYQNSVGAGFTVPGVEGKFVWHGTDPRQKPPDMQKVVQDLARGLHLGEAPDLNDKKLKKRVRELIFKHTFAAQGSQVRCSCKEFFDFAEEWAVHVRKLIWKELKKG